MALDEPDRRLFIASRAPARMAVFNTDSGQLVAAIPCAQDADDLYYDSSPKRIYVTGGEGYISVFQQKDTDHYDSLAKVPSSLGARTSGILENWGRKASTVCTSPFLLAPITVPRFAFIPCRIERKFSGVGRMHSGV